MKTRGFVLFSFIFVFALGILLVSCGENTSDEDLGTVTDDVTTNQVPVFRPSPVATPWMCTHDLGSEVALPFGPLSEDDPDSIEWSEASGPKISLSASSDGTDYMSGGFPAPMPSGKVVVKFSTGCGGVDPLPETWRQVSGPCGIHNRSISECEENCRRPSGWRQKTVAEEAALTQKNKEEE